ncbi:MAG: thiol-disulfide oxidoreductase DCC family protein [Longimicrobiales bacterium]
MNGTTTVIYDGECELCRRSMGVLRRLDEAGVLELVESQAPGLRERFPWITPEACARAVQVVEPDGHTTEGAAAVERLCAILPAGRRVRWLYRIPFARPIGDRIYAWISRNRPTLRLACGEHCSVGARGKGS